MVTAPEKMVMETGITELVIEDFKQKIAESLRKEKENIREAADKEAKLILNKAYQESTKLNTKAQEESRLIVIQAKEQANREAEALLSQAQKKVEQLFSNAEETIRKETKEKTRKEVDSILRISKEEAAKQSTKTLQAAKEEANNIVAEAKKEATQIARQLMDKAEKEAEEINRAVVAMRDKVTLELEAAQKKTAAEAEQIITTTRKAATENAEKEATEIITQAKSRAQKEREYLLSTAMSNAKTAAETEANQILQKARQEADLLVNSAKTKVRLQIEESSRLMLEIQQKMQQVIGAAGLNEKSPEQKVIAATTVPVSSSPPIIHEQTEQPQPSHSPAIVADKENTHSNGAQNKMNSSILDEENQTYFGKLKIDVTPPADNEQISILEKHLLKTANLRVIGKGGAEDGSAWIEIDAATPMPLVGILQRIPSVKDVVGCKSYIIVALKSKQ